MRKKTLALAVAGAFAVPVSAWAQQSNVEIYGKLYPEFTVGKTSGATTGTIPSTLGATAGADLKSRNSIDASNSRIGFRGKEDLGGGLSALFQIESTVPIDQGGGLLATRDSFVGLRGGFGTVRLGNMETVFKTLGDPLGTLGISSGNFVSSSNIISSRTPFSTNGAGSFHLRRANSLNYASPEFGGLQLHLTYGPDENRTGNLNADLWSFGVEYKRGPLELGLAHEIHNDFFAGSNGLRANGTTAAALANPVNGTGGHSKDKATRGTVLYSIGDSTKIQANYATVEFSESGGPASATAKFQNFKNARWSLIWEQRWGGPWTTSMTYANASAGSCSMTIGSCDTTGLNGNMWVLAGQYSFSKRTALFALYTQLNNGSSALYRNMENASPSPGADITQYAIGIRHNF